MPRLSPVQMVRSAELVMGKCQLDSRAMAEFEHNSATFVGSAVASTRRPSGDNGSFWQS